jgi:hypothetical protein
MRITLQKVKYESSFDRVAVFNMKKKTQNAKEKTAIIFFSFFFNLLPAASSVVMDKKK